MVAEAWKSPTTNLARSPLLVALVGRKMTMVRHQLFPQKPPVQACDSRVQGFSPPLARRRSSFPPPSAESGPRHPPRKAPNRSSEEARTWEHHPQPTIPPSRLNRQAESRRQPVSPALHPPERPFHTHITGRPGSSEVPRNPLTRWDVSSTPANGIFLTRKKKNAQRVEND